MPLTQPPPPRRPHALELVLAEADDAAVRGRWALLEGAGLVSLARHTGATNRPHVTLVSGPRPPAAVLETAAELLGSLLPTTMAVSGLALLGPPFRPTLAELVVPPAELHVARERLVNRWPGADTRPWVPHLTLAQRLSPDAVATALTALAAPGAAPSTRCVAALRWWDPDEGRAATVVAAGP